MGLSSRFARWASCAAPLGLALSGAGTAAAAPPTPGYPEPVVQWGVQKGETCDDIARSLYGSARWAVLVQRYNRVACKAGAPLREGLTLVLPEKPTTLPDARLKSMNPDVRTRPGGGGWGPAASGMPLFSNYNVNTLEQGRADIEFVDRTRVFLAPNTLVVIYGTANQTRVSKTPPAAVEVDSGEVKAVLAALRGDGGTPGHGGEAQGGTVDVAVKGGGRVSAASRDTVVQRKGDRTTVAVFDGKAGVTSGGKTVDVPTNHGTRFVGAAPPAPPRPLPPAPAWASGLGHLVMVGPGAAVVFDASWAPVPNAIQYRVELEREIEKPDGTTELAFISRHEVPASITAFHAEKLEMGAYRLRVRAIDREEYLGIAAEHGFRFVRVDRASGSVKPSEIEANPYGVIDLAPSPDLELALDDGPYGPLVESIDLRRLRPRSLRLRKRGSTAADTIPVHYTEVKAGTGISRSPAGLTFRVTLSNMAGIDVGDRVRPSARVHLPVTMGDPQKVPQAPPVRTVALKAEADGALVGSIDGSFTGPVRVDIVDDHGVVLGTAEYTPPKPPDQAPVVEAPRPQIGPYAPLWQATPGADVLPFAPTPANGASTSVAMLYAQGAWNFAGQVRASGVVGPLGLEAALHSTTTDGTTAYGAGWLGARWRVLRLEDSLLEIAPGLRAGFPASSAGMPAQVEPGVAIGGVARQFTWVFDAGGRLRTGPDNSGSGVPVGQGFLLAAGTMELVSWLRLNAALDAHVVVRDGGQKSGIAGIGAGVEAGTVVYGGLGLHLSPWRDPGVGPFTAQLALGFRGLP